MNKDTVNNNYQHRVNVVRLFLLLYIVLVLFLPNFISKYTTIYSISANSFIPDDPWQRKIPWLQYSLSIVEVPALLMGLFIPTKKGGLNIKPIIVYLFVRNLFRLIVGETSIFSYGEYGDYSLICGLLIGYGCYLLLTCKFVNFNLESAMDWIIILNFITQILFVITGRKNAYGGRYSALGSDVGEVSTICFLYLIYYLFVRKKKHNYFAFFASIFSLLISGSRSNLFFALFFILIFAFKMRKSCKKLVLILLLLGVVLIGFVVVTGFSSKLFGETLNRLWEFLESLFSPDRDSYLSSDSSFSGRIRSFQSGFLTFIQNPLGISTSAIDLQIQTIANGSDIFPHSTFLSYYLLWGLPVLYVMYWILKYTFEGIKYKEQSWIILLIIFIIFVFYGSPLINSKMYFWYFLIFGACKKNVCEARAAKLASINYYQYCYRPCLSRCADLKERTSY